MLMSAFISFSEQGIPPAVALLTLRALRTNDEGCVVKAAAAALLHVLESKEEAEAEADDDEADSDNNGGCGCCCADGGADGW